MILARKHIKKLARLTVAKRWGESSLKEASRIELLTGVLMPTPGERFSHILRSVSFGLVALGLPLQNEQGHGLARQDKPQASSASFDEHGLRPAKPREPTRFLELGVLL